jgi:hypothetical protein
MTRHLPERLVGRTPDQAVQKLKKGNGCVVVLKGNDPNLSSERRVRCLQGTSVCQHYRLYRSGVLPELVFDRGLGDLFVGRVGAAIADEKDRRDRIRCA